MCPCDKLVRKECLLWSGFARQDIARRDYVLAENVTALFFDGDSTDQLLQRHRLNRDRQTSTVNRYCALIQEKGIQKGARSEVVILPRSSDPSMLASCRGSAAGTSIATRRPQQPSLVRTVFRYCMQVAACREWVCNHTLYICDGAFFRVFDAKGLFMYVS